MKKIAIALTFVLLLSLLCSCSGGQTAVTSETLPDILPDLMTRYDEVVAVFRAGGLETVEAQYTPDENYQCYVLVSDPEIKTEADLRAFTETVVTKEYAQETFYEYGLDTVPGARYKEIDGALYKDIGQDGGYDNEWVPSSLIINEETDTGFLITLDYYNYGNVYAKEITLVKVDGGVRISAMTDAANG